MKFTVDWKGEKIDCEWIESVDFEKLKNVKQVSAFIFDDKDRVCLIYLINKNYWTLPGGGPEKDDKSFEETLRREVSEEADLIIKDIIPIGYLKNASRKNPKKYSYQLRYAARVKKIKPQTKDPANDIIPVRRFVKEKDFLNYFKWDSDKEQFEKAIKEIRNIKR